MIEARRPYIIVIDKNKQKEIIIDTAVPTDVKVRKKKERKLKSTKI